MDTPLRHSSSCTALADHVDGEDKTTTLIQGDGSCIGFPKRESGQDRIHQHMEAVEYRRESRRKSGQPVVHGQVSGKGKPPAFLVRGS